MFNQQRTERNRESYLGSMVAKGHTQLPCYQTESQAAVPTAPTHVTDLPTTRESLGHNNIQVPFIEEIENLKNYQGLANGKSNSRKRIITVRKAAAESKAVIRN